MRQDLNELLAIRTGHFQLESGHHGDLWLDLELLCQRPRRIRALAAELARRLAKFDVDFVCGPLVEGAFVGLEVASELDINFCYSERFRSSTSNDLFPFGYRIPVAFKEQIRDRRVAIVNDVINAGSAVRGTYSELQECGAKVLAIGTLLVLGESAQFFAESKNLVLESLAQMPNHLWTAKECPLCAKGVALENDSGG